MKRLTVLLYCSLLPFQMIAYQNVEFFRDSYNDTFKKDGSEYIAVFGDIQYYTNYTYINLYQQSINWIGQQFDTGMQIKCILHTGDICHNPNAISHWNFFDAAMTSISGRIPYYSMIGDHDYTWYDGIHIDGRQETQFNEHIQFPLSMKHVLEQFEPGRMENVVIENIIQSERIDFLILEFGPRTEVVDWANAYVKAHPSHKFIVMTHEYLEAGGGRRTNRLKSVSRLRNTTITTPDQLWERLVKCNDNVLCVLCGHVGGLYALTLDTNDFGREVPQIQHNIQSPDYRYDNWLMMWEFPADSDSANVFIYNTQTGQYYNNQPSLFRFKYREKTHDSIQEVSQPSVNSSTWGLNGMKIREGKHGVSIVNSKGIIKIKK